ncbi:3-deoxy-7-phosphoheptulonate synthase [Rhizoctonia solani]|uniref:Phospho-2-dehydro-3-deoxyheptonate aldolase n=1 Tax=Rhizoctonia solani TaxID=456999 RepID=A0A8H8T3R1_9AGAM|nr:3-deoxy-7-phosphoheptulonate synthase [Rhizoctonia solani]QRW27087.1 3-deoxy-7-phosphoheptulonate synthase [Rhizoctonia solani]
MIWGMRLPVVRIGRIAGQYAKPRSSGTEKVEMDDGQGGKHIKEIPSFRDEFERISEGLSDALDFCRTVGANEAGGGFESGGGRGVLGEVDFYTRSHDTYFASASNLRAPVDGPTSPTSGSAGLSTSVNPNFAPYNTSAHFLWIGDRTRQLDGAHIEYFRGIRNPIGIKVGPSMQNDELVRLLDIVNPDREDGKVTLITRYGASKIEQFLPGHISSVQASGHPVIWICDPMHGNTLTSSTGHKTRHFSTIISEITSCIQIHSSHSPPSRLGGISLEFTGELNEEGYSVTECLGGSMELKESELSLRYQTFCDPRLNFEQSLGKCMHSDRWSSIDVDRYKNTGCQARALFSLLHPSRLVPALPLISTGLQPNPPLRVYQLVMSMGPSILTVHERPNGDIGLALPNQTGDMYVLRGSAKPGPKGSRSTQDIVRCKDDMVLASVAWVDPKKDMIKIEKAAYMTEGERCGSWIPLGDAWKSAAPAKGDCTEQFNGSDRRPYEWKLELRNLRKLYAPDKTEHIAVETQFTPKGHVLEMNPVDCVGVGEMLYVTLLVGLARRRHKRKHGLPGVVSRVVENVLFM